ncbi:TPA: exodeoxyribonuclease V subunit beta [Stenotrophomonas maltophilia]
MNTAIAEDGVESLSRDPYLALSLEGIRLIEASAGTGKTFTLATLFTRLVVEQGLRIGQILAVTFTDAATQELRKRIRERLALAARLVDLEAADGEAPEVRLTRDVLQRHLRGGTESAAALKRRLQVAADEIDLASIFTIHGFCTRVLREHALESGHTFDPPELLASDRELLEELAADLWRVHANDPVTLEPLTWLWSSPDALAADLRALLGTPPLHPLPRPTALADPRPALQSAAEALSASVREHGEQFFIDLCDAVDNKWLNGVSYKLGWLHALGRQLLAWAERADPRELLASDRLPALLPEVLADKTNKKFPDRTPSSPLQAPLARYVALLAERDAWLRGTALDFLHTLRAEATQRLQALKRTRRVQTYDDLIDGVALALEGPQRLTLVRQLRAQYRIALVDEFQDTDDRQWGIFHTVFGDSPEVRELGLAPALFLIGDPKQAIYGFRGGDIHTYLKAKQVAQQAPVLDQNFRSRPSVLRALQALYDNGGEDAFLERDIRFERVRPGGVRSDADYLRDGQAAKALTLRVLRSGGDKAMSADASRDAATQACVAAIHQILVDARAGNAVLRGRPVQPGDIAVLVRSHREATLVQRALAAVGIPAVAAGKQSLFATAEARDLRALLLALLQPADEGRLRAALATVLLGQQASAIAAMEREGDLQRGFQAQLLHWRERWQRGGPFAVIADVCAAQGERLLALIDGERRLTNYLQLGELLQEASAQALGMHGLLDWLQGQMASADQDDEQQLLRLESDARRVQIITLHKSKGLEYPLVFLPFVGIDGGAPNTASHCTVHVGGQRQLHWKLDKDEAWEAANAQREREQRAEDARLLYVGLTRAEHALWIAVGDLAGLGRTRLAPLLGDLQALCAHADVHIDDSEAPAALPQLAAEVEGDLPAVRALTRRVPHDWWVYSFTQLAHADAGAGSDIEAAATELPAPAADEPAGPELPLEPALPEPTAVVEDSAPIDPRFMGSRFGNVLHEAMENVDFAAWGDWQPGREAPEGQAEVLRKALHDEGYADVDLDDGVAVLVPLVGHTLTVPLPEGGALYSLGEGERRAEIDFHFAIEPTAVPALLQVLHAHGVSSGRRGFGQRRRLEGLMTGMIDLTYVRDGRWYVLDYKSNRLPGYSPDLLAIAMRHSEYDLQALIYTVALHRWLRFRLGAAYDYERDMGGIRYLFCRGLDGTGNGVHVDRFPLALVDALDALFAGGEQAQAELAARARGASA